MFGRYDSPAILENMSTNYERSSNGTDDRAGVDIHGEKINVQIHSN